MSTPTHSDCPELEVLFAELDAGEGPALDHAAECEACAALMEEHRQLEKDLFRLADPLPPANLVPLVMARVATEPTPVRRELMTGIPILVASLVGGLALLFGSDAALARVGLRVGRVFVDGRVFAEGLGNGLSALWATAALPLVCVTATLFLLSLWGLRRLTDAPSTFTEAV